MTEIKELIAALREDARQMWNTGLVREGSTPLAEQAASALEALISRSAEMEEDNVYAQEIIAEFKSEVARERPRVRRSSKATLPGRSVQGKLGARALESQRKAVPQRRDVGAPRKHKAARRNSQSPFRPLT